MKRELRKAVGVGLIAVIGFTFAALPAAAARNGGPVSLETGAPDGHGLAYELVSFLGSWFQARIAPSEEALEPEPSPPDPRGRTDQENPGFQERSGGAADPDG